MLFRRKEHAKREQAAPAVPETLEEALATYLDALYATARMLTGEAAAAEDLVQETAEAACHGWKQLRDRGAYKSWLLRIMRNTFLNEQRARQRRPRLIDVDIDADLTDSELAATTTRVATVLPGSLDRALASVLLEYREALWLVEVEGLSVTEAAKAIGVPKGTVASRLFRGRRQVREALLRGRQA
jgi:RNA polymerase sigma-70 factor, ECF subfamily